MILYNSELEKIEIDESDMPITAAIVEFLSIQEWDDKIIIDENQNEGNLRFKMTINGQSHQFYIESHESNDFITVYTYSVFTVPPKKMPEMSRLLNLININLSIGRVACSDDDDNNAVQYKLRYDVTGGKCSGKMINLAVDSATYAFRTYGEAMASVALTKTTAKEAWAAYVASQEQGDEDDSDDNDAPTEL